MAKLVVTTLGLKGVNVDKNPAELDEGELASAQNGFSDNAIGRASLRKRPGLVEFTLESTAGTVLGGSDLPLQDLSGFGTHFIYLGRGPI